MHVYRAIHEYHILLRTLYINRGHAGNPCRLQEHMLDTAMVKSFKLRNGLSASGVTIPPLGTARRLQSEPTCASAAVFELPDGTSLANIHCQWMSQWTSLEFSYCSFRMLSDAFGCFRGPCVAGGFRMFVFVPSPRQ